MRTRLIVILLCLVAVVGAFLVARHNRTAATVPPTDGEEPSIGNAVGAGASREALHPAGGSSVRLNLQMFEATPDVPNEELWTHSWTTRARDPYYEMLFLKKGRDEGKESQLLASLMQIFEDKPDVQVGQISCTTEFCRAELLGTGEVNLLQKYGRTFLSALDPKGFRFLLTDRADPANPKISFYFGRDASWQVPDFKAELGL
jgi:hypothetical protein